MKDLNKIKAVIKAVVEDTAEYGICFKTMSQVEYKVLFGSFGVVKDWLHRPQKDKEYLQDYHVDDEEHVNYYINETILDYNKENPLSVPHEMYPPIYVAELFFRGYFLAYEISGSGSVGRYNFDRDVEDAVRYGDPDVILGITLFLLVVDANIPESVCVQYYIERLQELLEHSVFFERLKSYIPMYKQETTIERALQNIKKEYTNTESSHIINKNTKKQASRIFTSEEEEERQTDIVRKFISDNDITVPLDGSMRNPTLAMIHYFYTKWDKKRGMLRRDIIMQDVLDFFIQKCGVVKKKQKSGEPTKDKSITEKINALKRQDIELKPTQEIEEIKKTIEKL